jgi:hypothetical protein
MSEWWTYRLSDLLLFSPQTYYRLFELYNQDIWPMQLLTPGLAVVILVLIFRRPAWQGRVITTILAASWLWVAWAYHLQRYTTINWAANGFAAGFAVEAMLLIWTGVIHNRLEYKATPVGLGIFVFALAVQPLIGPMLGRQWIQAELFGMAPDPTAIATLGLLLLVPNRIFWELMIIPVIWCTISGAVLWTMKSADAFIAPLAALTVVVFAAWQSKRV